VINFSAISRDSLLGRVLRRPLQWLPPNAVLPVLQGELRGTKWVVGSSVFGCWLGSYEIDKQLALSKHLRRGGVFYDIGANVGFYSLLAARKLGPRGRVYAFEPLPANLRLLHRHLDLNRTANVIVHASAIAEQSGTAQFVVDDSSAQGSLGEHGELSVDVTSIDALLADGLPPPDVIKMDIEGAEVDALRGAGQCLQQHRPLLFVATHGEDVHQQTLELLDDHGYSVMSIGGGPPTSDELIAFPPQTN